ncbi:unnamed protein product [marine sediment metagenome]|uniref:Uncharacterized protein n=1 Tax=marine sediment metagenome TaxID=412755 RepID=X1KDT9_9ZZZZ
MVFLMANRNDTFRKFGPILLEATLQTLIERSNELRKEQGMPEITMQDIMDDINNHITELQPYDWMQEET